MTVLKNNIIFPGLVLNDGIIKYPKNKILKIPKGKCLDIGCGDFSNADKFMTEVIGIDFHHNINEPNFINGDLRQPNTWQKLNDNSFDLIVSTGVLHWLKNINFILDMCHKKLKHKGKMFHFFWHKNNFDEKVIKLMTNNQECMNTDDMLQLDCRELENIIDKTKFNILDLYSVIDTVYIDTPTLKQKFITRHFRPKTEMIILLAEKN